MLIVLIRPEATNERNIFSVLQEKKSIERLSIVSFIKLLSRTYVILAFILFFHYPPFFRLKPGN